MTERTGMRRHLESKQLVEAMGDRIKVQELFLESAVTDSDARAHEANIGIYMHVGMYICVHVCMRMYLCMNACVFLGSAVIGLGAEAYETNPGVAHVSLCRFVCI